MSSLWEVSSSSTTSSSWCPCLAHLHRGGNCVTLSKGRHPHYTLITVQLWPGHFLLSASTHTHTSTAQHKHQHSTAVRAPVSLLLSHSRRGWLLQARTTVTLCSRMPRPA